MNALLRRRPSLLGRMFKSFAAVALVAWCGLIAYEVKHIRSMQNESSRQDNIYCARALLMLGHFLQGSPQSLHDAIAMREAERLRYFRELDWHPGPLMEQVWLDGRQVYASAPALKSALPAEQTAAPELPSGRRWNAAELRSDDGRIVVRRWAEVPGYWHFSNEGLTHYARPLVFSMPVLLLMAWLILRNGLRPLRRIGQNIASRHANDLSPLPPSPYAELAPVVESVNRLMALLQQRMAREREFLVDAAHELKTPLAVLEINADRLLMAAAAQPGLAAAREGLHEGVQRINHTVTQLLTLMRSGSAKDTQDLTPQDLASLLRDRLALLEPLARERGIELALQAPEHARQPLVREGMASLIDNLIDNAIKYGRSQIHVSLDGSEPAGWRLSISDDGPGIPPALHAKVFERFYRLPGQDQPGSGLGLAIVEQVAARHGATLSLGPGPGGQGLSVTLAFAPASSAQLHHQAGLARKPVTVA